jgi:hypothetical protein
MAITSKGLNKLGFTSGTDYILEVGDSGIEMTWLSGDAQPTVSAIETAHTQWENDVTTKANNKTSGRNKLVALGLTADELDAMGL